MDESVGKSPLHMIKDNQNDYRTQCERLSELYPTGNLYPTSRMDERSAKDITQQQPINFHNNVEASNRSRSSSSYVDGRFIIRFRRARQ